MTSQNKANQPVPTIPFTPEAYAQMQQEVKRLTALRVEVMERLKTAREMGDLSENGAYHYAKFELGNIGRQLRQLKPLLAQGQVVTKLPPAGVVGFGSRVTLRITATDQSTEYLMVTQHESNPREGKLSLESPLGQAIIGRTVGDTVQVETPRGSVQYRIEAVQNEA